MRYNLAMDTEFTTECAQRSGDYSFAYAVVRDEYESHTEHAAFENVEQAQALVDQFNQDEGYSELESEFPDDPRPWRVFRRAVYKTGSVPSKRKVYTVRWTSKIVDGEMEQDFNQSDYQRWEHELSDQILTEQFILNDGYSWRGRPAASFSIVSMSAEAARTAAEAEASKREPVLISEAAAAKARSDQNAREAEVRRLAQAEAKARKERQRAERLAARGLPVTHTGPTDAYPKLS